MTNDLDKIQQEIELAKTRLAELEKQAKWVRNKSPEVKLAELIHDSFCRHNHTDGCSWLYESWDKPGHARNKYLHHAMLLTNQGIDLDRAEKIIKEYNELRPR